MTLQPALAQQDSVCTILLFVAVINAMPKNKETKTNKQNLGEEKLYVADTSWSQTITEGSQGMIRVRRHKGKPLTDLLLG